MANGTTHREIARADRIRERQEQEQRATRNALDNLRRVSGELPPYREEMDSSEVTVTGRGFHAKGVPRWAAGAALVLAAISLIAWVVLTGMGR